MPKVSVNLLTKDRAVALRLALESIARQTWRDFEAVIVNDGSTDETEDLLKNLNIEGLKNLKIIIFLEIQRFLVFCLIKEIGLN